MSSDLKGYVEHGFSYDCHGIEKDLPETQKFLEVAEQGCPHFAAYRSEYQKAASPLTADMVKAAMTPNGHTGSWLKAKDKMLNALIEKRPIRIGVLGGSMTAGAGVFDKLDRDPWPQRLTRIMPHGAEIANLATPGTMSEYPLVHFESMEQSLSTSDIIIVDYAVNDFNSEGFLCCALGKRCDDWEPCDKVKDPPTYPRDQNSKPANMASLKTLVRLLSSLPQKPSVVFLETFQHNLGYTCHYNITRHSHWSAIKAFDLPVISYKDAICKTGRTFWMEPNSHTGQDTLGPHPSTATHELVAQLVGGALQLTARRGCQMESGDLHDKEITPITPAQFECFLKPTTMLNEHTGIANSAADVTGWRWFEDAPGKPGWIAEGKANKITFPVQTQHGQITIEYLSSYENIGNALCSIDGEGQCEIQGLWSDKSSQSSFTTLHTTSKGQVHVTCESDGRKFKIISVSAC